MSVKLEEYSGVCVLSVNGDLAGDEVAAARKVITEALDRHESSHFVIDLEKTPFIDSEGLESLLWTKRQCEDRLGQVKLAAADDNVRKILEITRLASRFECHGDVAAALKSIR